MTAQEMIEKMRAINDLEVSCRKERDNLSSVSLLESKERQTWIARFNARDGRIEMPNSYVNKEDIPEFVEWIYSLFPKNPNS